MTLRVHGHFDIECDDCHTTLCTDLTKPTIAFLHAEKQGWGGITGRRGMYCPDCREAQ